MFRASQLWQDVVLIRMKPPPNLAPFPNDRLQGACSYHSVVVNLCHINTARNGTPEIGSAVVLPWELLHSVLVVPIPWKSQVLIFFPRSHSSQYAESGTSHQSLRLAIVVRRVC
jgi:hypothetical protein